MIHYGFIFNNTTIHQKQVFSVRAVPWFNISPEQTTFSDFSDSFNSACEETPVGQASNRNRQNK